MISAKRINYSIVISLILVCIAIWLSITPRSKNGIREVAVQPSSSKSPEHQSIVDKRIALIREMAKSGPDYKRKMRLDFFGKVVDQNNQPVSKAKVKFHYVPDVNGDRWYESETAEDGTFSYGGVDGQFLFVKVGAPSGYLELDEMSSRDYNYAIPGEFNFHVPDPAQPVIFKVWKLINPEPMNNWTIKCDVNANDGNIIWFDIKNGTAGGSDLGVCILDRSFVKTADQWRGVKVVAGAGCGVLESNGEPMMYAPEGGYKNEILHTFNGKGGEYIDNEGITVKGVAFVFKFYFRHSDGSFASVIVDVNPARVYQSPNGNKRVSKGVIHLSAKRNPSGKRSLEYLESLSIQDNRSRQ